MRISDWSSDVCSSDLWKNFASAPYTSQTHGDRFVVNHANDIAEEPYGRYENIGTMPPGGIIATQSITISPNGNVQLGPPFTMENMAAGRKPESNNGSHHLVLTDGQGARRTPRQKAKDSADGE